MNHTHIFDEFDHTAQKFIGNEVLYLEDHPDFMAACELGRRIARLWALKLRIDFPFERFRVYYTQYDNPIVRFHKVRDGESYWLPDDALQTATDPSFRNAAIFDTATILFASDGGRSYGREAAKRLAALGGTTPDLKPVPRRRMPRK